MDFVTIRRELLYSMQEIASHMSKVILVDYYDKVAKVRGMDIVFVTTAQNDEEARELLSLMGAPFEK